MNLIMQKDAEKMRILLCSVPRSSPKRRGRVNAAEYNPGSLDQPGLKGYADRRCR